jgi:hypothetical protein
MAEIINSLILHLIITGTSSQVAVSIDNFILGAIPEVKDLTEATFNNCIIYGSFPNELNLRKQQQHLIIDSITA